MHALRLLADRKKRALCGCAADIVMVSPARKAPIVRADTEAAQAALGTAAMDMDVDESDEALARPPAGCSARQQRLGQWLQRRAHLPSTLLAVFYLLKLRTWIGMLVRCSSLHVGERSWLRHARNFRVTACWRSDSATSHSAGVRLT
jgi:hypothetical protein